MAWDDLIGALAKEDSAAALLAVIGGLGTQYSAQRDAIRRQQQAIAAAQAQQAQMQQQRQAQVVDMARRFTPQETSAQLEQTIAPQQQRLEGVAQQAATQSAVQPPPGSSSRYTAAMGDRAAEELQRAIAEAGMSARAGGGQRLMFEQGLQQAQGASDLDNITSAMRQAARQSESRIARAGQLSPAQMFWGGTLTRLPAFAQYLTRRPGLGSGLTTGAGGVTGLLPPSGNAGLRPRGGTVFGPAFSSEMG